MRRPQLVFVTAVFTALLTGILVQRSGSQDPSIRFAFTAPRHVPFEELVPPDGEHALEGVVKKLDGSAAVGVAVHAIPSELEPGVAAPLHAAFSAADGSFRFDGLWEGDYELVLVEPGHPVGRQSVTVPTEGPVDVRLGPESEPVDALPPLRRSPLEGRLAPPVGFTRADTPLEGYEVVLTPAEHVSLLSGAIERTLAVDPEGFFRVDDLVEADYVVRVLPLWASGGSWPVLEETVFTHGSATGLDESLALRLRCGEVQGRVTDVERDPVRGALAQLWPLADESRLWPPVQTDENGVFRIPDVAPGSYEVRVQAGATRSSKGVQVPLGGRPFLDFTDIDPRGSR